MKRPKGGNSGKDAPIEDPEFIRRCLKVLCTEGTEFPLKVEGASTLPYTSQVEGFDWEKNQFILRLLRPLPHELAPGATFCMVFTADEKRYEALATFAGREAYLQYRFRIPRQVFHMDRRRPNRMPFRPREAAYVVAHSSSLTGVGVAGPLLNISMGGLAMRLDRLLRLEDRMLLPIHAGSLDIGLVFERLRLQDLPRLPFLEVRGRVAHLTPRGEELTLGIEFGDLTEEEALGLQTCLSFREKAARGSGIRPKNALPGDGQAHQKGQRTEAQGQEEGTEDAPQPDGPLRILQRRTTRLGLVMASSESAEAILALLRRRGYLRIERVRDPRQAGLLWDPEPLRPQILISDIDAGLEAFKQLQTRLGSIPGVLLSELSDPSLMMELGSRTRILPLRCPPGDEEEHWIRTLDGLVDIEE